MTATITIEREGEELEVEIIGTYHKAERGSREYGMQLEPDHEAWIEIIGPEYILTDSEEAEAIKALERAHEADRNECDGSFITL